MSSPDPEVGSVEQIPPIAPAPDEASPSARSAQPRVLPALVTLIRREIWEHRQLWLAPLVVAVLVVACAFVSDLGPINLSGLAQIGPITLGSQAGLASQLPDEVRPAVFGLGHWLLSVPLYLTLVLVLSFYLGDCLYAERKDRSILFWKSLPVSDLTTVGSKALVGLVLVPLGVYVLALVTDLLFSGIWHLRAYLGAPSELLLPWDMGAWLRMQGLMLIGVVVSILWYAPIGAYLLLVSAWARRAPFLWASLPPLLIPLAERLSRGTHYIWDWETYRSFGVMQLPAVREAMASSRLSIGTSHLIVLPQVLDHLSLWKLFANIDVWGGVVVAVALILLTARIRRYRDET